VQTNRNVFSMVPIFFVFNEFEWYYYYKEDKGK